LIGSREIAVCANAQYKIGQKQLRTTGATSGGLKLQCIAIATFSNFVFFIYKLDAERLSLTALHMKYEVRMAFYMKVTAYFYVRNLRLCDADRFFYLESALSVTCDVEPRYTINLRLSTAVRS